MTTKRWISTPFLVCAALTAALLVAPVVQAGAAPDNQASAAKKKCKKKKKKCKKKAPGTGSPTTPGTTSGDPAALILNGTQGYTTTAWTNGPQDRDFIVTNVGDQTSGPIDATVGNGTPAAFSLNSNGCAGGVAGHATCAISVRFTPTAPGIGYSGLLTVTASPGGSTNITLSAATTV